MTISGEDGSEMLLGTFPTVMTNGYRSKSKPPVIPDFILRELDIELGFF